MSDEDLRRKGANMPEPRGQEDPVDPWNCYSCSDPGGYVTVQTSNGPCCLICLGKMLFGNVSGVLIHQAERLRQIREEEGGEP